MADKIEQLDYTLEENNKRIEDLQDRYEKKQQLCTELSSKLEFTQKILEQSRKTISALKEDYKQAKFAIKEREYIISNHKKAENTLTEQACTLRSDLERSVKDIEGLFAKIGFNIKFPYFEGDFIYGVHGALFPFARIRPDFLLN